MYSQSRLTTYIVYETFALIHIFTPTGIKFAVKLVEETKSFKEINGKMLPVPFPGCEMHPRESDAYFECLGRHTTATAYKYCATAPMGRDTNDPVAVVDSFLR